MSHDTPAVPPATLEAQPTQSVEKIDAAAATIDFADPTLTVTYGAHSMNAIAAFSDNLLSRVRTKDAGPIGETLSDLMSKVKSIDIENVSQDKRPFWERVPLVGSFFNSMERTMAQFTSLADHVDSIAKRLDTAMIGLLKDIEILEQLYEHNKTFHDDLSLAIAAGKKRLEQARNEELPKLQSEAQTSQNSMDAQKVRDFAEKINRFERRLHDLDLSRTITLQTAPQIRLIQSNNQTLAEKIQTSILNTIPIWKHQMVLALSLYGQRSAAAMQKHVADTTNELLRKNAEMLESATIETAREVERSVVDIETLRDVHKKLLSTIEETIKIAEEGRTRRRAVEQELVTMEKDLRSQLASLAQQRTAASITAAADKEALPPSS